MLNTVKVPEPFRPLFEKAQEYVSRYFDLKKEDPSQSTIEIFGERYILVRAASMSVDFFDTVMNLYSSLETTNRELMRANRELQEFAYITAHDLKTPLRGIGNRQGKHLLLHICKA